MIFSDTRDPRLITVRRGGTLSDEDHHLLALWAADCAEHVVKFFEDERPDDPRPREAIALARAWTRGDVRMSDARRGAGAANTAARDLSGPAREAAHAAGQAGVVPHVAEHELGAAAYGIRAARAAATQDDRDEAGRAECRWQREQLPDAIRELVMADQVRRNANCWNVFTI